MYAIIETGGKQFWVAPGETIRIEKIKAEEGQEVAFKALWAVADAQDGQEPAVFRQATVGAVVLGHKRGPKILVFKKRPKKATQRLHGHRQDLTDVQIKSISFINDPVSSSSIHGPASTSN